MPQDLFNFPENDNFKELIVDDGIYTTNLFIKILVSFVFLFLFIYVQGGVNYNQNLCHFQSYTYGEVCLICSLLLGSIFIVKHYGTPIYLAHISKNWYQTTATIDNLQILKVKASGVKGSGVVTLYIPSIQYTYTVNELSYKGDRLSFNTQDDGEYTLDPSTSSKYDNINANFGLWMKTREVTIYYNPKQIHESVVYRKIQPFNYFINSITVLLCLGLNITFFLEFVYCLYCRYFII